MAKENVVYMHNVQAQKDEILSFGTAWVKLEDIMLKHRKKNYHRISHLTHM
jgi:hypothetical protein